MSSLSGCNAIVTGGSRGIGAACCLELAKEGANVAIVANQSLDEAEVVAQKIREMGRQAIVVQCDVGNPESIEAMVQSVYQQFEQVHVLVNNAGIAQVSKAEDLSYHDWQRMIDVNLTGVFLCAQKVGQKMIEQHVAGSIINISSICGHAIVEPDLHSHYNASKAGVSMLSKSLAFEWAPHHIRVNTISPGYIKTEMTNHPEWRSIWAQKTPLGHMGQPVDIARAVVLLASDKSKFTTGADWIIDGGYTC